MNHIDYCELTQHQEGNCTATVYNRSGGKGSSEGRGEEAVGREECARRDNIKVLGSMGI